MLTPTPGPHTDFLTGDAAAVLKAASLTVLGPDAPGTGLRIRPAKNLTDRLPAAPTEDFIARLLVVPVVNGHEELPAPLPQHNDRRAAWGRLMQSARTALTAAGFERRGETSTGTTFIAHIPAVRMARAALAAAQVPLLPWGVQDGAGAFVYPVDGDQHQVRIVVWAGGHRHKPDASHQQSQNPDSQQWRTLMQRSIDVMKQAGWVQTCPVIHDCAQFRAPDDTDLPEWPMPVLGCDLEADDFTHHVASILRQHGYTPLAAHDRLQGPAWGFRVDAPLASDHVMVTYSHRRTTSASAPYRPAEKPKVDAMLAAYRRTLARHSLTFTSGADATVLWVRRPARSTRARIALADECGFAWLPPLARHYRHETRWTDDQPWAPQLPCTARSMLRTLERVLRKGWATAEADSDIIYLTATEPSDFAPYSRYVPLMEP